jgi:hypothetical protein
MAAECPASFVANTSQCKADGTTTADVQALLRVLLGFFLPARGCFLPEQEADNTKRVHLNPRAKW